MADATLENQVTILANQTTIIGLLHSIQAALTGAGSVRIDHDFGSTDALRISVAGIGQSLEAATGTVGKQGDWTKQALELQRAGGLESPKMAAALMVKAQESFKDFGGIQDPAVAAKLLRLAPKLGAAGISESDLDRIFSDEEKAQEDAWDATEKKREKHAKHYVKPPKPKFGVAARDFETFLEKKLGTTSAQGQEYLKTPLGASRSDESAQRSIDEGIAGNIAGWDQRMINAEAEQHRLSIMGEDSFWTSSKSEAVILALQEEIKELKSLEPKAGDDFERDRIRGLIKRDQQAIRGISGAHFLNPAEQREARSSGIESAQMIQIFNQHITQNNPIVHPNENQRGLRASPEQVAP